jgi:deoxyadenosine/deoxycytidine kinase
MVHFIQHGNIGAGKTTLTKLSKEKAWLIEECGFKGKNEGKTKFS